MGEPRKTIELKAAYSLKELAEFCRLPRRVLARILKKEGMKLEGRRGEKQWIFAADLKEQVPRVWESMVDLQTAQRGATRQRGSPNM